MTIVETANRLHGELIGNQTRYILIFAYNKTGKTRLSMEFKNVQRNNEDDRHTLYFNAFTEDLFNWDNDLEDNTNRVLKLNRNSRFFNGLESLDIDNKIRELLSYYVDFDFTINYADGEVAFYRGDNDNIKISRGEENIFIWCFYLAIAKLAIDEAEEYSWVRYLYIDDPISSLDENNAIQVASYLGRLLKEQNKLKAIISSHHSLFFNVIFNELGRDNRISYFLTNGSNGYELLDTTETPYFYHVGMLRMLVRVANEGNLFDYHFNILRGVLEKTAVFHGYGHFSACLRRAGDGIDATINARIINILSHEKYSIFRPQQMNEENKNHFITILNDFIDDFKFNRAVVGTLTVIGN